MNVSALQSYTNAAKLGSSGVNSSKDPLGGEGEVGIKSSAPHGFKSELSSFPKATLDSLKQSGADAEKNITAQILGTGNVEKTAMSIQELSTHMEIVSQALRVAVEKINELTTRTMGG